MIAGLVRRRHVGLMALMVLSACAGEPAVPADLVLRGGKVVTVDENIPDGQAIAVKGDTILAVGSNREISRYIGRDTEVIDLDGQLAIPGFVESHGCPAIIRQDRVEFCIVYISAATGELVQEVMEAATVEDARIALGC